MGNDFCKTNFIEVEGYDDEEKEVNDNYFINTEEIEENNDNQNEDNNENQKLKSKKKAKYNFYLNKSFLSSTEIDEESKYRIRQIYTINRINFISKKTKEYLDKLFKKKNSVENLKILLKKNQTFSKENTQLNNKLTEDKCNTRNNNEY